MEVDAISEIKNLIDVFFLLEKGSFIEKHTELVKVFSINNSKHIKHPHEYLEVSISRKALKHCIERRREELKKRHSNEEVIQSIYFAIDNLKEVIINFDSYTFEPPSKYFYSKDYSHLGRPVLRVLLEHKGSGLEVISIHFKKNKKN